MEIKTHLTTEFHIDTQSYSRVVGRIGRRFAKKCRPPQPFHPNECDLNKEFQPALPGASVYRNSDIIPVCEISG